MSDRTPDLDPWSRLELDLHAQLHELAGRDTTDADTAIILYRLGDLLLSLHHQRAELARWHEMFARDRVIVLVLTAILVLTWGAWVMAAVYW